MSNMTKHTGNKRINEREYSVIVKSSIVSAVDRNKGKVDNTYTYKLTDSNNP